MNNKLKSHLEYLQGFAIMYENKTVVRLVDDVQKLMKKEWGEIEALKKEYTLKLERVSTKKDKPKKKKKLNT